MKVFRNIENYDLKHSEGELVLSVGNFDGVHRGHQEIIKNLIQISKKKKLKNAILTFDPHPKKVLFNPDFRVLQDFEEKCSVLSLLNVDILISHTFDREFATLNPNDFVLSVLKKRLNTAHVVLGDDFSCGANCVGKIDLVREILRSNQMELTVVQPYSCEGREVHSTMVRDLIQNGQIEDANKFLFAPYSLSGIVIHGECRGRELGFPTINFHNHEKIIPAKGVYFTSVLLNGKYHEAVTNIGNCPTFSNEISRIETHILDFNKDLYGKYVQLFFYKKIRNEIKFDDKDTLVAHIKTDIEARKNFSV